MALSDLGSPSAFIFHHTGGRGDPLPTLQQRGLGVQYIMDREGNIRQVDGPGAQHIRPGQGAGAGLSNANVHGMEVIARDNRDVTPAQIAAAKKFIAQNYPDVPIYGHGEINPHKQHDEGTAIANAIREDRGVPLQPGMTGAEAPRWSSGAQMATDPPPYGIELPRALAERARILAQESARAPFAPQPMQIAHAGALAGFPPQAPAGGPMPLFPSNAMAAAGPVQAAPNPAAFMAPPPPQGPSMPLFSPQAQQPQPAGQQGAGSFFDFLPAGQMAGDDLARWWARQSTMTG